MTPSSLIKFLFAAMVLMAFFCLLVQRISFESGYEAGRKAAKEEVSKTPDKTPQPTEIRPQEKSAFLQLIKDGLFTTSSEIQCIEVNKTDKFNTVDEKRKMITKTVLADDSRNIYLTIDTPRYDNTPDLFITGKRYFVFVLEAKEGKKAEVIEN